jgi:hypothetical protein
VHLRRRGLSLTVVIQIRWWSWQRGRGREVLGDVQCSEFLDGSQFGGL